MFDSEFLMRFGRFWSIDLLLNLLIYLSLHSHSLIPTFGPPICCLKLSFSAEITKFRVSGSDLEFPTLAVLPLRFSGTTGPAVLPPPAVVLPPGPGTDSETAFQRHGFGHIFCIRTPFLVLFGSFRSYDQGLHHHCGCSIIHHHQNPWASTTLLQQRVKNIDERYNIANLYPLPFRWKPHYIFARTMSYWG